MFWCVMRIERETAKALVVGQLVWVVADQRLVSVNFSDTGTNVVTPVYDVRSPAPSILLYLKLVLSNGRLASPSAFNYRRSSHGNGMTIHSYCRRTMRFVLNGVCLVAIMPGNAQIPKMVALNTQMVFLFLGL